LRVDGHHIDDGRPNAESKPTGRGPGR
jgi:hypothetical protein